MRAVARILIVGGGCRGRLLAQELVGEGHAVRVTTRRERARGLIEGAGAECWIGAPQHMGTFRTALEGVSLACWLLASASGKGEDLRALHGSLLERFVNQLIDTTVRGFVYEGAAALGQASGSDYDQVEKRDPSGGKDASEAEYRTRSRPFRSPAITKHRRIAWPQWGRLASLFYNSPAAQFRT